MERIGADLLIPGRGRPVPDGKVVLDGGRISYAGPAAGAPDTPGGDEPGRGRDARAVGMPGLWDCHGHFLGARAFDLGQLPLQPQPQSC